MPSFSLDIGINAAMNYIQPMQYRRWLIPSLVFATLLLDGVVVPWAMFSYSATYKADSAFGPIWESSCPTEIQNSLFALVYGQIILYALWASSDNWFAPWKWLFWGIISTLGTLFFWRIGVRYWQDIFAAFFLIGSTMILGMWILRLCGMEWKNVLSKTNEDETLGYGRFQYPLRLLLEWMTALAIIMGLWQYAKIFNIYFGSIFYWYCWRYLLDFAVVVFFSTGLIWLTIGNNRTLIKWSIPVFILLFMVMSHIYWNKEIESDFGRSVLDKQFIRVFVPYVFGSLWLVRMAGYRLQWKNRKICGASISEPSIKKNNP
jgi:hypothetical protein